MSNMDKKNISANALDENALENVSGGYEMIKGTNGNTLIGLKPGDIKLLSKLGYDVPKAQNGQTVYYQSLKNCNGKDIGAEDLETVLTLYKSLMPR